MKCDWLHYISSFIRGVLLGSHKSNCNTEESGEDFTRFFIILEVYMSVVEQITDQEVENCYFLFLDSLICGVDVE